MENKFDFFVPQNGTNLVRFVTKPFQCFYHIHDFKQEMCLPFDNFCLKCIGNGVNILPIHHMHLIGLELLNDNNDKKILKMTNSLFYQMKIYNRSYGNPAKYNFDLQFMNGEIYALIMEDSITNDFKEFYMKIRNLHSINKLIELVKNKYFQYHETLKTLLIFS